MRSSTGAVPAICAAEAVRTHSAMLPAYSDASAVSPAAAATAGASWPDSR